MSSSPLLEVHGLSKNYGRHEALHDVSFTFGKWGGPPARRDAGRTGGPPHTLAVVGASGSGKTSLARCLAGFEKPSSGEIQFAGQPHEIQLIFQQPAASLNPRFTAAEAIEEPLVIQRRGTAVERRRAAERARREAGLPPEALGKRTHEFSGGERQRLAIARALVLEPKLLILDESLTGLDPGLQTQIIALLRDLQTRLDVAYILISHDLVLATSLATDIAVMDGGKLVELAPAAELLERPSHPRTRELIDAARALTV
jgi:ABC-type dipeptide/oligopeptide/nickel transport system ATPase subunit